ncbi:MAG TPA: TonB-dependent receptor [Sphingomicrobium sp.]
MKKLILLASTAVVFPTAAFAQSTGTVTTEEEKEIVVTGTRALTGVDGVVVPDTTKAKGLITQELIQKQSPGQTILSVVNLVPSVNFTNSDPYGSSGGNIRIRGFDGNRISLTFDGVPLNDSGNYAIFSSQQLDPELIEQVNVGLGVTDVDSPTASAAGGTINYRTLIPSNRMGARLAASFGSFDYRRFFGMFETGEFTSFGTKAWLSASSSVNDKFKGPGEINKRQYNARIYQPIGNGGDFVSLAAHWNRSRNNFYRNPGVNDLRTVFGSDDIVANADATADDPIRIGYFDDFDLPNANDDRSNWEAVFDIENDPVCVSAGRTFGGCSNYYNIRFNPSNTGNIRGQSRFTLTDQLILTVDPSFQYVLAHGGGSFTLREDSRRAKGANQASPGVDYNGDGDFTDTVRFFTPNITNTHRLGLTSSLIYDLTPQHRIRVAYTFDRARHRQTGQWGFLEDNGDPESIWSGRNATPVLTNDGFQLQQRDRRSIALLNQISGQYIGRFFNNDLRVEVGVRRPFFKRDLETFCPIQATDGFAYCTSEPILPRGTPIVNNPAAPDFSIPIFVNPGDVIPSQANGQPGRKYNFIYAPFEADYKFGKLLPNVGFTYRLNGGPVSFFGSYAKGFSAPRTDNLYRAPIVEVDPEETNAFDLGVRYTNNIVQAQGTLWKIDYKNRIVSSFNPDLGISIDRNVGKVASWGVDASVAVRPIRQLSLLAIASYIDTELKDNVQLGSLTAGQSCDDTPLPAACAPTKGKMVTETPHWQWGGRANLELEAVEFGVQGKWVGSRFATDTNDVKVKGYATVDLDARLKLGALSDMLRKTYIQFNVINLFDKHYFGNISTQINAAGNPNFSVGSPRTIMGTLNVGL